MSLRVHKGQSLCLIRSGFVLGNVMKFMWTEYRVGSMDSLSREQSKKYSLMHLNMGFFHLCKLKKKTSGPKTLQLMSFTCKVKFHNKKKKQKDMLDKLYAYTLLL